MNNENPTQQTPPIPLTAGWSTRLPRRLEQELERAPVLVRTSFYGYRYVVSDHAELWPVRSEQDPGGADLIDAATAYLLDEAASLTGSVSGVEAALPGEILDKLEDETEDTVADFVAKIRDEVHLHHAAILTGRMPRPHSPASDIAFQLIVEGALFLVEELYSGDDDDELEMFVSLGGNENYSNTIELIAELLAGDRRIFEAMHGERDFPHELAHWFTSYPGETNPWSGTR
jgi:hypothetical protein